MLVSEYARPEYVRAGTKQATQRNTRELLLLGLAALAAGCTVVHVAAVLEASGAALLLLLLASGALSFALLALVTAGLSSHFRILSLRPTFRRPELYI